jgi:1,2-diacylglycerol 3-alpha-glucosyltransferase
MKLALIVPGFSSDDSDWCIPAHTDIARTLAETNEVHVYTMRYPHRVDTYRIGNINVHSFNGVGSRGPATARLWQRVIAAVSQENKRGRFDLVHSIFGSEAGGVAVLVQKSLGIPSVVWMVDGELVGLREINYGADLYPRQRWMNKLILASAARVLCGCSSLTTAARARNLQARVETLPLGVNTARFHPSPNRLRDEQRPNYVNVGSLVPIKDQVTLLNAFALVVSELPTAHLTIAGAGPLENDLRALASQLGLENHVTFTGQLSHDALPALYHSADVFVQASLHEGQGMALLEAGACGCALAGTDVGILSDLAHDGNPDVTTPVALACPVASPAQLARVMLDAYAARSMLGARAASHIEKEYNLQHIAGRLMTVYRQLKLPKEPFN